MRLSTEQHLPEETPEQVDRRIRDITEHRLRYYADHPERIPSRLRELDHEWDMGRTLQANAAGVGLAGFSLGALVWRRFYLLPATVLGFLLQQALQGWSPPAQFFRCRGFRTRDEINAERRALRQLQKAGTRRRARRELRTAMRELV